MSTAHIRTHWWSSPNRITCDVIAIFPQTELIVLVHHKTSYETTSFTGLDTNDESFKLISLFFYQAVLFYDNRWHIQ